MLDAGIVDQYVHRRKSRHRLLDQRAGGFAVRHVGPDIGRLDTVIAGQPGGDGMIVGAVSVGVDDDIGALRGQRLGYGEPDARGRAGDDCGFPREHDIPFFG